MLFETIFSTSLLASAALGHTIETRGGRKCGAPKPDQDQISVAQSFAQKEAAARESGRLATAAPINVNVYVHVVSTSTNAADGYLSVRIPAFLKSCHTSGLRLRVGVASEWELGVGLRAELG